MFIKRKEYQELKDLVDKIYKDHYDNGFMDILGDFCFSEDKLKKDSLIHKLGADVLELKNPNGVINAIKYTHQDEYRYVFLYKNNSYEVDDILGYSEENSIDEYSFDSTSMILTLRSSNENTYSYVINEKNHYPRRINLKLDNDSNNWIKINRTRLS